MEMVELEDRALSTLEMVELEDRALSTLTRCIKLLAVLLSLLACISFAVTLRTVSGGEKEGGREPMKVSILILTKTSTVDFYERNGSVLT